MHSLYGAAQNYPEVTVVTQYMYSTHFGDTLLLHTHSYLPLLVPTALEIRTRTKQNLLCDTRYFLHCQSRKPLSLSSLHYTALTATTRP